MNLWKVSSNNKLLLLILVEIVKRSKQILLEVALYWTLMGGQVVYL